VDEDSVDGMLGDTQVESSAQTINGIAQPMKFCPPDDPAADDESLPVGSPLQTEGVPFSPGKHPGSRRQDPADLLQRHFRVDLDVNRDTAAGKAKTLGSQTLRP